VLLHLYLREGRDAAAHIHKNLKSQMINDEKIAAE